MKKLSFHTLLLLATLGLASTAHAHCQVPCGIYGDRTTFDVLQQHVATIQKASTQINELAASKTPSAQQQQQLVRWVNNKESHAQLIIDSAANYFLAQRIKTDADHYADKLALLHEIILYAMKSKQSTDGQAAATLSEKLAAFQELYLDHHH